MIVAVKINAIQLTVAFIFPFVHPILAWLYGVIVVGAWMFIVEDYGE